MKKVVDIRNESGFGLISVLAMMLIVSVAILGLFMSIEYARAQADLNYHQRSALLIAQGYLDKIKCDNRNVGTNARPMISSRTESVTLENNNGKVTRASVIVESSTNGNPYSVSGLANIYQDEIKVTVRWKEKPTSSMTSIQNKSHSIMIKEDYYWKRSNL